MLISTQTRVLGSRFGHKRAVQMLAEAGFEAYDCSLTLMKNADDPFNQPNYLEFAHELRATADEAGIVCNQAHAPFPTSRGDDRDEAIFASVVRSLEVASILGAKNIVVHPCHHLKYDKNAEILKEINLNFYNKLIPLARELDINIATENMWQRKNGWCNHSVCSHSEEFCEYVDMIDDPHMVACLDLGHVMLVEGGELQSFIRALGKKRLQALHVHDNDYVKDQHLLPTQGRIDFKMVMKTLAEIGYEGDMTFESDEFLSNLPDAVLPEALCMMNSMGKYLRSLFEAYQA